LGEGLKLRLKNFRGIKQGTIKLEKLTILVGANNSGKTSLLEALFLLPNPLRVVPYSAEGGRRRAVEILSARHSTLGSEAYIFLYHNYSGEEARISLVTADSTSAEVIFKREGDWINVFTAGKRGIHLLGKLSAKTAEVRPEARPIQGSFDAQRGEFLPSRRLTVSTSNYVQEEVGEVLYLHPRIISLAWNFLLDTWIELRATGLMVRVAERVSRWVPGEYDDVLLEPFTRGRYAIYLRSKSGHVVRLGDVGDGIQLAVTLMLLYEYIRPRVLAIDDIESHANPMLLEGLTQWIGEVLDQGTTVVLSTHSLEAVKTMAGALEDYEPRIVLTSLREGVLDTRSFTLEDVERLEEAGIDVRLAEGVII